MKNKRGSFLIAIVLYVFLWISPMTAFADSDYATLLVKENGAVLQLFNIANLMPGDTVVQNFDVVIQYDNDVKMSFYFTPDETRSSPALLEALQIKIYIPKVDAVVFEGSIADFNAETQQKVYVTYEGANKSNISYQVTLSLPAETGNECMNAQVIGDFVWRCDGIEKVPESDVVVVPGEAPKTGDDFKYALFLTLAIASAVVFILLVRSNRRKKDA